MFYTASILSLLLCSVVLLNVILPTLPLRSCVVSIIVLLHVVVRMFFRSLEHIISLFISGRVLAHSTAHASAAIASSEVLAAASHAAAHAAATTALASTDRWHELPFAAFVRSELLSVALALLSLRMETVAVVSETGGLLLTATATSTTTVVV